ncbi:MAG: OmpA family protein [Bacteroidota bacterium]
MSKTFSANCLGALLIFFLLPLFSCVSKKKFLSEVERRNACDSTLQAINNHNLQLNKEIAGLKLQLAEKTGEGNALREIYDKQVAQIDNLEAQIRTLNDQSLNKQEELGGVLQQKNQELAEKQAKIDGYKMAVEEQEEQLRELIGKVAGKLNGYSNDEISLEVKDGLGYIVLSEKSIYRKGSTRLSNNAYEILDSIAMVILQYPQMDILVLGHTDNQPVRTRSLKDNWDLSVLRATPVARMLVDEFGINPNQVITGGKGDSKPRSSNDTSDGRRLNRRTEIIIYPPTDKILKMVKSG